MSAINPICRVTGSTTIDGYDVRSSALDPVSLRTRIRVAFRKPNPSPNSDYQNVTDGPHGRRPAASKPEFDDMVVKDLQRTGLWAAVKDRQSDSRTGSIGGRQQSLCVACAVSVEPENSLISETCLALVPMATERLEEPIDEFSKTFCCVMARRVMQHAACGSQRTAFCHVPLLQPELRIRDGMDLLRSRGLSHQELSDGPDRLAGQEN